MYMNDIHNVSDKFSFISYADATVMLNTPLSEYESEWYFPDFPQTWKH